MPEKLLPEAQEQEIQHEQSQGDPAKELSSKLVSSAGTGESGDEEPNGGVSHLIFNRAIQ